MEEPLPIRSRDSLTIHPGEQVSVTTGIRITLPEGIHGIISPIGHPRKGRPLVASGILLANSVEPISVLLANPYNEPIQIRRREIIALLQIQENEDVSEIYVAGGVEDLGVLPEEESVCHVVPEEQIGDINAQEKQVFLKLLDEFQDIFAKDKFDLGKAHGTVHKIDTNHNGPLFQHAYRRSPTANKIIQEEVNRLLKGNLIKKSNSPWASPLLLVKKKDGTNRVVINYRKLNAISEKGLLPFAPN